MLTVRAINTMGDEVVYLTKQVNVKIQTSDSYTTKHLYFVTDDEEIELSGKMVVYVMNENGKTVAKYRLGVVEAETEEEI